VPTDDRHDAEQGTHCVARTIQIAHGRDRIAKEHWDKMKGGVIPLGGRWANKRECKMTESTAPTTCTVSVTDANGSRHSVEVIAESLYEAAAWVETPV
jgi:hypothetical protein